MVETDGRLCALPSPPPPLSRTNSRRSAGQYAFARQFQHIWREAGTAPCNPLYPLRRPSLQNVASLRRSRTRIARSPRSCPLLFGARRRLQLKRDPPTPHRSTSRNFGRFCPQPAWRRNYSRLRGIFARGRPPNFRFAPGERALPGAIGSSNLGTLASSPLRQPAPEMPFQYTAWLDSAGLSPIAILRGVEVAPLLTISFADFAFARLHAADGCPAPFARPRAPLRFNFSRTPTTYHYRRPAYLATRTGAPFPPQILPVWPSAGRLARWGFLVGRSCSS